MNKPDGRYLITKDPMKVKNRLFFFHSFIFLLFILADSSSKTTFKHQKTCDEKKTFPSLDLQCSGDFV